MPQFVPQSLTDVSASGHRWFLTDPRAVARPPQPVIVNLVIGTEPKSTSTHQELLVDALKLSELVIYACSHFQSVARRVR